MWTLPGPEKDEQGKPGIACLQPHLSSLAIISRPSSGSVISNCFKQLRVTSTREASTWSLNIWIMI